jgi:hypothetical protein
VTGARNTVRRISAPLCCTADELTELAAILFPGSDVLCIKILGNNIIMTNSFQASVDLLEKRSNIYSDRYVHGLPVCLLRGMFKLFVPKTQCWPDYAQRAVSALTSRTLHYCALAHHYPCIMQMRTRLELRSAAVRSRMARRSQGVLPRL